MIYIIQFFIDILKKKMHCTNRIEEYRQIVKFYLLIISDLIKWITLEINIRITNPSLLNITRRADLVLHLCSEGWMKSFLLCVRRKSKNARDFITFCKTSYFSNVSTSFVVNIRLCDLNFRINMIKKHMLLTSRITVLNSIKPYEL